MKISTSVLLVALFTAVVAPLTAAAFSDPAAPVPQLDYIDPQLEVFWPRLQEFQATYLATYGVYYQVLGSHSLAPVGSETADRLSDHPTDQETTLAPLWDTAGLPYEINWAFSIETYSGPSGAGYVLVVYASVDDVLWVRALNYGPEAYRELFWFAVVPNE